MLRGMVATIAPNNPHTQIQQWIDSCEMCNHLCVQMLMFMYCHIRTLKNPIQYIHLLKKRRKKTPIGHVQHTWMEVNQVPFVNMTTRPETKIAPANRPSQTEFHLPTSNRSNHCFSGAFAVSFGEGRFFSHCEPGFIPAYHSHQSVLHLCLSLGNINALYLANWGPIVHPTFAKSGHPQTQRPGRCTNKALYKKIKKLRLR